MVAVLSLARVCAVRRADICLAPDGAGGLRPERRGDRLRPVIDEVGARSLYMNQDVPETERNRRFAAVCEPLRADLYRFVFWLSRDPQVTEDVVQETLLRAWRSLDALKEDTLARQWLLTIARREHARLYERKRHPTVDIDALVASEETALGTSDERDRDLDDVRRAIFELDDDYREPLVLQVLLGYTTQEIADHMNLNSGAVLTRLFRARNRLRKRLGLAGGEDDAGA